jgi:hypothetical protein
MVLNTYKINDFLPPESTSRRFKQEPNQSRRRGQRKIKNGIAENYEQFRSVALQSDLSNFLNDYQLLNSLTSV